MAEHPNPSQQKVFTEQMGHPVRVTLVTHDRAEVVQICYEISGFAASLTNSNS